MSTEEERSVPADLFSALPAGPQASSAASREYVPVVRAHTQRPPANSRGRSGALRRGIANVAVVWGGLTVLLTVLDGFAYDGKPAYFAGQVIGFLLAIALFVGGSKEVVSQYLRRFRWLPWLLGFEVVGTAFVVVALLLLRPAYPAYVRTWFVNSCTAQGSSVSYCGCVLNWFESNRSLADFTADAEATDTEKSRADMSKADASCTSQKPLGG